jgi:hypothetical protein
MVWNSGALLFLLSVSRHPLYDAVGREREQNDRGDHYEEHRK